MSITTTRTGVKINTWYRKPGVTTGYVPPPQTTTVKSSLTQTDSRPPIVPRRKPRIPNLSPTAYSRTIYSNWGVLNEYARTVAVADAQLLVRCEFAGDNGHSGSVHRALNACPARLEQAALVKARLKIKDQQFNAGQALAERKLTADLVSSNLGKIARAAAALRRGRLRQAAAALGISRKLYKDADFMANWLELQYGWKPLLSDIHGAVTTLSDLETARAGLACITVTATTRDAADFNRSVSQSSGVGPWIYSWLEREEYRCKVSLTFTKSNPTLASAAQLGFTNPLALAWELLPFSFVVDWALPIGDYFSQLDASLGWTFNTGTLSKTTRCRRFGISFDMPNPSAQILENYGRASSNGRAFIFSRSVYQSEPVAIVPQMKAFDKFASYTHVENAIALLAQAFR